jgi:hypothetical protein
VPDDLHGKINDLPLIVFQLKDITGFGSAAVDSFRIWANKLFLCFDLRVRGEQPLLKHDRISQLR